MERQKRPRIKRSPDVKPGRRNGAQQRDRSTNWKGYRDNGNRNAPANHPEGDDLDKYRLQRQIEKNESSI